MSVTHTVNSNQVDPRHTKIFTYRCFLPDLTGFVSFHCVGPSSQCHLYEAGLTSQNLSEEFNPAVADCRLQGTAISPSSTESFNGGKMGIRTPGRVSPTHAFQACSLSHSDISPRDNLYSTFIKIMEFLLLN